MDMYSEYDGLPVESPSDLNFDTTDKCDDCGEHKHGRMYHAAAATGRVCAVLFICDDCQRKALASI